MLSLVLGELPFLEPRAQQGYSPGVLTLTHSKFLKFTLEKLSI